MSQFITWRETVMAAPYLRTVGWVKLQLPSLRRDTWRHNGGKEATSLDLVVIVNVFCRKHVWYTVVIGIDHGRELRQQHPSDSLSGAGTSRQHRSLPSTINPLNQNNVTTALTLWLSFICINVWMYHDIGYQNNTRMMTISYTLSREYRMVRYRYSRLLFTSEDRLCANLRVQEQSTNMTSQC